MLGSDLVPPPVEASASKKDIRKIMKQKLASLPIETIQQQSCAARDRLLQMPEYVSCQRISIFMSMPKGELQTEDIVRHALRSGKKVFVPYIYKTNSVDSDQPSSIMDMLQLRNEDDYQSLTPDKWGIPSIDASSVDDRVNCFGDKGLTYGRLGAKADSGLDVVLVPAVAFDREMNRLGHGKGYYDNFLTRYFQDFPPRAQSQRTPHLIGLALEDQILPPQYRLPVEPWDHSVDLVVLGNHVVKASSSET